LQILNELEAKLIEAVPEDPLYEDGFDSVMWIDDFLATAEQSTGINPKQAKVILVNLEQKNYIGIHGGAEGTFWLEDYGREYLAQKGLVDEEEGYKITDSTKGKRVE